MKKELSALDIHYLLKELDVLIDSKIDKIFLEGNDLLLQLHVPNKGISLLRILVPNFMFISSVKGEYPQPDNFCMSLRKYLTNARLRKIEQKGFERIIELVFEAKEGKYSLVAELFSKGNIILLREDSTIVMAKNYQKWKDRTVRGGIPYEYPKREYNFLTISKEDLADLLRESDRESVVKALAMDLGLGGTYAEEICLIAGIDKNKKDIIQKEADCLYGAVLDLRDKEISPIVYEDDFSPFDLRKYSGRSKAQGTTFSSAVEEYYEKTYKPTLAQKKSLHHGEKDRLEKIISKQKEHLLELETEIADGQAKGEKIYERYQLVQEILLTLQKAREKYSWKEIKEKIKGHPLVKEINEKDGQIVLEL